MKTINIDNVVFDKQAVLDNRESIIKFRNEALAQADFEYVIILSFTIALLHHLAGDMG